MEKTKVLEKKTPKFKTWLLTSLFLMLVMGSASAVNWTAIEDDVKGAMGVFAAFVAAMPEIIINLFVVIILLAIAGAISLAAKGLAGKMFNSL